MSYSIAHHPHSARRPFVHHSLLQGPAVNIRESEEAFWIDLVAPGRDKTHFELSNQDQQLHITVKAPVNTQEGEFRQREFSLEENRRTFRLPSHVDVNGISAAYNQGILTVKLPKRPELVARTIEIE